MQSQKKLRSVWVDILTGVNKAKEQKLERLIMLLTHKPALLTITAASLTVASARSKSCQSFCVKRWMIYNYTFGSTDPSRKSHPRHCPN